jgi:hypothetical protein
MVMIYAFVSLSAATDLPFDDHRSTRYGNQRQIPRCARDDEGFVEGVPKRTRVGPLATEKERSNADSRVVAAAPRWSQPARGRVLKPSPMPA